MVNVCHRECVRKPNLPKRCFTGVTAEVVVEMLFASERFLADAARKRLVGRMAFHVSLQTGIVGEHMIAHIACEHAISVVRFSMRRQLLCRCERLTTHLAHERLSLTMVSSMHDQLVFVSKHFAANIAGMRGRNQRQTGHVSDTVRVDLHHVF